MYGGGGITPDIILPYRKDSSFIYYNRLAAAGLINRVAFDYVKHHAAKLQTHYADADNFYRHFQVSEALVQEVVTRGEQKGIALQRDHIVKVPSLFFDGQIPKHIGNGSSDDHHDAVGRNIETEQMEIEMHFSS